MTAGLAGALTGCSGSDGDEAGQGAESADGAGLRRRTARTSSELLSRYDATARVHPALGPALASFRETVVAHLDALGDPDDPVRPEHQERRGRTGGTAARGDGAKAPVQVPANESEALGALIDAERRAAEQRLAAVPDAPPELARLLASLAAAGAVQAELLGAVR